MPLDAVVIGAGPAGLQAAAAVSRVSDRFLLVDAGRAIAERQRYDASDIAAGVGGAGLFSDGKFSFFPAATELWRLRDRRLLRLVYHQLLDQLAAHGIDAPPFPESTGDPLTSSERDVGGGWCFKAYPSIYVSPAVRAALTRELFQPASDPQHHRLGHRLCALARDRDGGWRVTLEGPGVREQLHTRHLVLAGGRFLPAALAPQLRACGLPLAFRRVEFGVRIEDRSESDFFAGLRGVDPKYRMAAGGERLEWRTFCCCREGEVVGARVGGLLAASGRADCPPSGRSNIGLLVRVLEPVLGREVWSDIAARARSAEALFDLDLGAAMVADGRSLSEHVGERAAGLIARGLQAMCGQFPGLAASSGARVIGPCLEGVGDYLVDRDLQVAGSHLWVAGDCAGRFRGLVAAMLSGAYVGGRIVEALRASACV